MKKINGIKSVDFVIKAQGFGVVNWNGSASLYSHQAGKYVDNHLLPKMRNVDILRIKNLNDIPEEARLYISQNCIRHEIFKDFTHGLKEVSLANVDDVLPSLIGLVSGYLIAQGSTSLHRKSPLLMTDFLSDENTKLNYEQFSKSGPRNATSIFSKHTTGEVNYSGYGSINIEDLQFIALEDSLGRSSYREIITEQEGLDIAEKITDYLKSLDFEGIYSPKASFANNYVKIKMIRKIGEAGVLLNNDAILLVVKEIISLISNLYISRSRAFAQVVDMQVDYNSGQPMRIKLNSEDVSATPEEPFAIYYESEPFSAEEYETKVKEQYAEKERNRAKKIKNKDIT